MRPGFRALELAPDKLPEALAAAQQAGPPRRRPRRARPVPDLLGGTGLRCPSAPPHAPGAELLAVRVQQDGALAYLEQGQPVTSELLAAVAPAHPEEVLRFSAPCPGGECLHFRSGCCQLVREVVRDLEEVTAELPACSLRRACRWFSQEGVAACRRCPQLVTSPRQPEYWSTRAWLFYAPVRWLLRRFRLNPGG